MATIHTHQELQDAIRALENRQSAEKSALQQHFNDSMESVKPVNVITDTVQELNQNDEIKQAMIKAAVGLAIGYVTKKLIDKYVMKNNSRITSRIGTAVQVLVAAWVAKNGAAMKNIALHFFKKIIANRLQQPQQRQLPASASA